MPSKMIRHPKHDNGKGKGVADDKNRAKRARLDFAACTPAGPTIREPASVDFSYSSSDDDVPTQLATTVPAEGILKQVEAFELGECSKDVAVRKHSVEAASYAISSPHEVKQSASPVVPSEPIQALHDQQIRSKISCAADKRKAR